MVTSRGIQLLWGDCSNHGVLYIFLDGELGSVLYEGFTRSAANVACRQLGFVRMVNFSSTGDNWDWIVGECLLSSLFLSLYLFPFSLIKFFTAVCNLTHQTHPMRETVITHS